MKKEYTAPELERVTLKISFDVLSVSTPESTDAGGGAGQVDPTTDPFGGGF